jgi:diguanylate cyclase (GGDEF)-like protein/PAS domain S-box-containing protein
MGASYRSPYRSAGLSDEGRFLLRAQRIAAVTQGIGVAVVAAYPFLPGHHPIPMDQFVPGLCLAAIGAIVTAVAPWRRLVERRWVLLVFYAWTIFLLGLITWLVAYTGGERSEMWALYIPIAIFVATTYPRAAAGVVLGCIVGANLVVGVTSGWDLAAASLVVRLMVLTLTLVLAAFLAEERYRQTDHYRRAWVVSKARAEVLRTVASVPEVAGEGDRLLASSLLERATELGFDVVAACRAESEEDPFIVEDARGLQEGLTTKWRSAFVAMAEMARSAGRSVVATPGHLPIEVAVGVACPASTSRGGAAVVIVGVSEDNAPDELEYDARREGLEILARLYAESLEAARLHDALVTSEARFRSLVQHTADMVLVVEPEEGRVTFASPTCEEFMGKPADAIVGSRALDLVEQECVSEVWALVMSVVTPPGDERLGEPAHASGTCMLRRADGALREVDLVVSNLIDDPAVGGIVVTVRDVTERREAERARAIADEQFRLLADLAPMGAFVIDMSEDEPRVIYANERCREIYGGVSLFEVGGGGASWVELLPEEDRDSVAKQVRVAMEGGSSASFEHRLNLPDGRVVWVRVHITPVLDPAGRPVIVVGTVDDVSELKHREEQLLRMAGHDPLTGLANRSQLAQIVSRGLSLARRQEGGLALLYCDLDRFKEVNDTLGHQAGDELLVEAARRLRSALRTHDTALRLGGDELVVACEGITEDDALGLAARLAADLGRPYVLSRGQEAHLSVSIGISFSEDGMASPVVLLAEADAAMYEAKQKGVPVMRSIRGAPGQEAIGAEGGGEAV